MRARSVMLAVVLAMVAGAMGLIPSGATAPSAIRLHIAPDGKYFELGSTRQSLTTSSNSCRITSAEPLIDLSSTPSGSVPGLVGDGIGVKRSSSSSNGTSCAQVDSSESLTIRPGSSISNRTFVSVRLDLEITKNAVVLLTFSRGSTTATYKLQTGRSITSSQANEADYDRVAPYTVSSGPGDTVDACAAPNSSGPNSGSSDNCQWSVAPGFAFDTVKLTTQASSSYSMMSGSSSESGPVTLEGSNDFGGDPAYDTLFFLSNSPPTANPDTVVTDEDTAVSGNVLGNDTDPDGNSLSATRVSGPSNGTLSLASDGAYTYTPAADYFGTDSFQYDASDGTVTSRATVSITVNPVNDPPVSQSGSASTPEDETVTITVATDVDSPALTVTCTGAQGGTVVDNGDGTIDFTPPADFNGTITLSCDATDSSGATTSTSATIVVGVSAVNDPPTADDDVADVDEGASVTIDVVANDDDIDNDPLTPVDIAAVTPSGATAVVNPDRTVTYTPPVGYEGPGSFTYRANDGTASSNVASVSITVFPVLCSLETVTDTDGDTTGSFTRLSDPFSCKRFTLLAAEFDDTVLFQPQGLSNVTYRGRTSFGPEPAPTPGGSGSFPLLLRYDPTGGDTFRPVQWCVAPVFDANDDVTTATIPAGETWCVASADTRPDTNGDLVTTWQVYGEDDPKFTR